MTKSKHQIRSCDRCRWWERTGDSEQGECRAGLPQQIQNKYTIQLVGNSLTGVWPVTAASSWCGKFSADVDLQQDLVDTLRNFDQVPPKTNFAGWSDTDTWHPGPPTFRAYDEPNL
jgi:hypothetical protein